MEIQNTSWNSLSYMHITMETTIVGVAINYY